MSEGIAYVTITKHRMLTAGIARQNNYQTFRITRGIDSKFTILPIINEIFPYLDKNKQSRLDCEVEDEK